MQKKVNLSLTIDHERMMKELASAKGITCSYLIRRWIERTYKKYIIKKEQSQDD